MPEEHTPINSSGEVVIDVDAQKQPDSIQRFTCSLGTIDPAKKPKVEIVCLIRNKSAKELVINRIDPSCGCVTVTNDVGYAVNGTTQIMVSAGSATTLYAVRKGLIELFPIDGSSLPLLPK